MSKFRRIAVFFVLLEIVGLVFANVYGKKYCTFVDSHAYKVDVQRVASRMQSGEALSTIPLDEYPSLLDVSEFDPLAVSEHEYEVVEVNGVLYRFSYQNSDYSDILLMINIILIVTIFLTVILLLYLDRRVIRPFGKMNEYATELAKGNLTQPLQQDKSHYFKRFVWGVDMLREKLEDDKKREYELLKEKQTMVLSLSHDIKTPLAAMELYTKALSSDLYPSEEARQAALLGIKKNIAEISNYVSQIAETSREDLIHMHVENQTIYLSGVLEAIRLYYQDKCQKLHITLDMAPYDNCLIQGDHDRLVEVLQNLMENAIKYGDGQRISISVSEEEDCKLIAVRNTGCTLREEELPNLFDSFYRGSNSEKQPGSGLGLYICKSLLRCMEGDIFASMRNGEFCVTAVVRKA